MNSRSLIQASRASIICSIILISLVNSSRCLLIHRKPYVHRRQTAFSHILRRHASESDGTHEDNNEGLSEPLEDSRRSFVKNGFITLTTAAFTGGSLFVSEAGARGLVRFPCKDQPLLNTYHFMRAGSSLLEVEDVWSTNPLFLTNREAALSEKGEDEVRRACNLLKNMGVTPTIVRYSLAASSIDTANIVGEEFNIGRDRLVPEFNYMDPRAIGGWDFSPKNATEEAVWAMDFDEAGPSGRGGRPPPNEDGTPSETLADQVVRLTNLMSVLETLYSGDEIILVFPDGTGPALLSCLIGGIPLYRVHELNFQSGEIRQNVDYNSVNAIATDLPSPYYSEILQRGRQELMQLRENPDEERNVKDLKFEEERAVAEAQRKERQELEERETRQNEFERRQKLEEERRIKEEQRKERQIQVQEREIERKRMRENEDNSTSDISGGAVGGGILLLAVSSVLANSKQSAVIDTDDNRDENGTLSNATIPETSSAPETNSADIDEVEVSLSDVAKADTDSVELDQPITMDQNETAKVFELASATNIDDEQINLEDSYDDWGDAWLGTINEIMNDDPDISSKLE
ncbi:phosphoglycerate mutase family protein [Skeletonema marinoi]|uniref:Phosphoglycerate mutase family protein n=1 Tax=Skeletonema marinoi TaxID=267567 RepID=A0AAD9D8Q5_9STRA|nr:phosphoglycerate mutase family protein [Skeletonema marinoi]